MSLVTGNNSIDSLVYSSWNAAPGTPVSLTYSFMSSVPADASADDRAGFVPMTLAQQQAAQAAMAQWADVANISFTQVASDGNIQLGTNDQGQKSSGYAYLPNGVNPTYLFTNNADDYNSVFRPGTYGPTVLLHELGHTLGLKHPGNYDTVGGTESGPFLPSATDNGDYTVMSYNVPTGYDNNPKYNVTPMLYDIQAMQYLYGANLSYHSGDDTYVFVSQTAPQCVWDAGGTDTLDFSGCGFATTINLNAGAFSSTVPGYNNISIAYNVTIEKAIAGDGGSTIVCNNAGDTITGGSGADVITDGGGSDHINAGGGTDTVIFSGAMAHYTIVNTGSAVDVTGDGADVLTGVEFLQFSDTRISVASLPLVNPQGSVIQGTAGADSLTAGPGNDTINGGDGIDVVHYTGTVASYSLASGAGGAITVTDLASSGGVDTLTGVERLQFSDGALALDTNGEAGQLFRLYGAMFNRAPDAQGLGYWLYQMDHGGQILSVASSFIDSGEFLALYGQNVSNQAFATSLYHNVLHREPDTAGLAYWVGILDHNTPRDQVLIGFSDSAEYIQNEAAVMPVGIAYVPWHG